MAEVNTEIYKNQPNPVESLAKVYSILGADQALKNAQQANQVRQYELDRDQADQLRAAAGPLVNVPNIDRPEVITTITDRARQLGVHPRILERALAPFSDPHITGERLRKALTIQGVSGRPETLTQRQDVTGPQGQTTSVPAPATFGKPTPSGIGPGATAAATATGGGAGALLTHSRENSIQFPRQAFPLEQAITSLERLGTQGTGPGTDTVNHIKSFALSMGLPGVDASKIVDYDSAKKYLTDFVNQTGSSGTNDKLAAAFAGNPSVHISNEAAVKVAKSALALRRVDEARQQAFDASGKSDEEYTKFASKWNREHDVRVYGFDLMTPAQRHNVLKDMTQAQRDLFMLDVDQAKQAGLLRAPRIMQPKK